MDGTEAIGKGHKEELALVVVEGALGCSYVTGKEGDIMQEVVLVACGPHLAVVGREQRIDTHGDDRTAKDVADRIDTIEEQTVTEVGGCVADHERTAFGKIDGLTSLGMIEVVVDHKGEATLLAHYQTDTVEMVMMGEDGRKNTKHTL